MSQCEYWMESDSEQWCELKDHGCTCGGRLDGCSLRGTTASTALTQAERVTLREAADRVRRRHHREVG